MPMTPDEFGKMIAEDTEKWAKVVRAANIKPVRAVATVRYSRVPLRDFGEANVRFGSKADIAAPPINVRFTPKSGHRRE
jgi:hypothetical protein